MIDRPEDVTVAVLGVMARTSDPRLRQILEALVRHLHEFVREIHLTEDEFREGVALLNEIGQLTTDSHNEMMLMAGSLGISSLVCLLNNGDNGTSQTVHSLLGPFWRLNSPELENGGSIVRSETPGPVLLVNGRVVDKGGRAVVGAEVDVWHASPVGLYENQDPRQADMNLRGKFTTNDEGRFWFRTVKMAGYPIPTNGVVGRLLHAQGRHPFRPAHLHVLIFKEGFKTPTSQVYVDDDQYLETDVQFGVTRALIGKFVRHNEPHDSGHIAAPWYQLDYTFTLEPGIARMPRPPIK
jgi:catechol 1,2-dioxygenase